MHINSKEAPIKNQLVMGEVTHKFIYMFKSFNFINMEQTLLLYFNTLSHVWVTNEAQHVHIISINQGRW